MLSYILLSPVCLAPPTPDSEHSVIDKNDQVQKAKLAEQDERYDVISACMKSATKQGAELSKEERNLLSVAYKNVAGAHTSPWRVISSNKPKMKVLRKKYQMAQEYRQKFETKLRDIYNDILSFLETFLIPNASQSESTSAFKMKGDYYHYLTEVAVGYDKKRIKGIVDKAQQAYQEAFEISRKEVQPMCSIRQALALNFFVFYYEILNSPEKSLCKRAFDEANAELDTLSEESYKDSMLIMQLLRNNVTLWTSDTQGDEAEAGKRENKLAL
ncbi:14-3-3 protein zeta/delta-like [Tamandua tetradactyla]|uniref:14-3-3 protein zeta/delta-like n=1 Tax=Tamandua tetradactyla TaxID=48850 RepID=UPI004053A454